jgi:hypothetical protein
MKRELDLMDKLAEQINKNIKGIIHEYSKDYDGIYLEQLKYDLERQKVYVNRWSSDHSILPPDPNKENPYCKNCKYKENHYYERPCINCEKIKRQNWYEEEKSWKNC